MNKDRQSLISIAADPNTKSEQIQKALAVIGSNTKHDDSNRFMSEQDARMYAGNIARSTLYLWRKRGLKSYRIGGRRMYRPSDLEKFISSSGD